MNLLEGLRQAKCRFLKELSIEEFSVVEEYSQIREITSCEYSPVTLYMWKDMYHPHLFIDENYLIIFQNYQEVCYSLMPLCKPTFFQESFEKVEAIFQMMGSPFIMYCVDEKFADFIRKEYSDRYQVCEERELADYIYAGDKLRSLQGKKLSAKRNHINAFMKENQENKVEARSLNEEDIEQIHDFLTSWYEAHAEMSTHLEEEWNGIQFLMHNYKEIGAELFGVFVNDRLEAFSIGSLYQDGKGAIIHVEKANTTIRGLYPYINQQFLVKVFSDVEIVNREDDLGIEGLRKAKNSYDPLFLEKKYVITPL